MDESPKKPNENEAWKTIAAVFVYFLIAASIGEHGGGLWSTAIFTVAFWGILFSGIWAREVFSEKQVERYIPSASLVVVFLAIGVLFLISFKSDKTSRVVEQQTMIRKQLEIEDKNRKHEARCQEMINHLKNRPMRESRAMAEVSDAIHEAYQRKCLSR